MFSGQSILVPSAISCSSSISWREDRKRPLTANEQKQLDSTRNGLASAWLIATGKQEKMIGRDPAELVSSHLTGFWWRPAKPEPRPEPPRWHKHFHDPV